MINIYSSDEIKVMKDGGRILAGVLQTLFGEAKPGVTTMDLEKRAQDLIAKVGAKPSFMMEKGYHWATCMNINDMVVHGIPNDYVLVDGDKLGIDVGVFYKGFHTDTSWSCVISGQNNKFLTTGERALNEAIKMCKPGNYIGDISKTIQEIVEGAGYSCVKQLVGHGVGKQLHEDPEIPCYLRGRVENTPKIKKGMVLAIEVIYNEGGSPVVYGGDDGWTIVTRDGKLAGLFEHTVAVGEKGAEILTKV